MKRTAAILMTVALAFGGAACSGSEDSDADAAASSEAAEASAAASDASEAADDASSAEQNASEAATSLAAEASKAGSSLAAEASEAAAKVDWDQYPDQLREEIDTWVEQDNCSGLSGVADSFSLGGNEELVDYVNKRIEEADCA